MIGDHVGTKDHPPFILLVWKVVPGNPTWPSARLPFCTLISRVNPALSKLNVYEHQSNSVGSSCFLCPSDKYFVHARVASAGLLPSIRVTKEVGCFRSRPSFTLCERSLSPLVDRKTTGTLPTCFPRLFCNLSTLMTIGVLCDGVVLPRQRQHIEILVTEEPCLKRSFADIAALLLSPFLC
jgi:hypothetical protein